jgi:hypothetical protein
MRKHLEHGTYSRCSEPFAVLTKNLLILLSGGIPEIQLRCAGVPFQNALAHL